MSEGQGSGPGLPGQLGREGVQAPGTPSPHLAQQGGRGGWTRSP